MTNKLSEFIDLGGIYNINLENWNASDDTIMHIIILKCLKKYGNLFIKTVSNWYSIFIT